MTGRIPAVLRMREGEDPRSKISEIFPEGSAFHPCCIMKIDSYSFGHIEINGRVYTSDVIIFRDFVNSSWWRKEGHSLYPDDITEVLNAMPEILIIGTGYLGMMHVPEQTVRDITSLGIAVRVSKTAKAVELYNSLQNKKKTVMAALHITC